MRKPSRLALRAERQRLLRLWRQHQADLESWRRTLRPCFLHLFAQRAATLRWSRTLLTLLVDELQTDDRFFELVGDLRYLPVRQYPQAIAIAIALRHSWRPDDLARLARRLGIHLSTKALSRGARNSRSNRPHTPAARHTQHVRSSKRGPSRSRLWGSPPRRQGSPLRSDPVRGWRP